MLHVLLLVLKIIGIIILVILGLILLILCVVLFVPIRYQVMGNYDREFILKGKVHWLLHVLTVHVHYNSAVNLKEVLYQIKIFGITVISNEKKKKKETKKKEIKKKEIKKKETKKKGSRRTLEKSGEVRKIPETDSKQETLQQREDPEKGTTSAKQERRQEEKPKEETIYRLPEGEEKQGHAGGREGRRKENRLLVLCEKMLAYIRNLWKKIKAIPYTIKNICDKVDELQETIQYYRDLWESEETKRVLILCKKQLRYLYRKLKPQKFQCEFLVGLEDPYYTGQILVYHGMLYPWIGNNVFITGDFEQVVFQGEFILKGKIRIFTLIKVAVVVYFDKNIRNLLKRMKREDKENG